MIRRLVYCVAVVAQLGFLGWMVAAQERRLEHGTRVVLAVEPFDPIHPLSGRYLDIRPKVGRIDLSQLESSAGRDMSEFASGYQGQDVEVILEEKDGRWTASSVGWASPDSVDPNRAWLRGTVTSHYGSTIVVDYELNRYFIPHDASDPSPLLWSSEHEIAIVVKLDVAGRGTIEDLLVDGQPFAEWNRAQPK